MRRFFIIIILVIIVGLFRQVGALEIEVFRASSSRNFLDISLISLTEKLIEAEKALENLPLKVGSEDILYQQERITHDGVNPVVRVVKEKEPEKQIGLALLDQRTGKIRIVTITKRGDQLISPIDLPIDIIQRPNGIKWNKWNTQFKPPEHYIVLKNIYPEILDTKIKKIVKDAKGKQKVVYERQIERFIYSPYSEDLHVPEIVDAGRKHIASIVTQAFAELRRRGVKSRAFPGLRVADVTALRPEYFELLPLIEQTDFLEFILDPRHTTERALVLIGANPSNAYARTGSSAGALGWVQYTNSTYQTIRRTYSAAQLTTDFTKAAADHLNSMMAAILLYDYNLATFMKAHGKQIAQDPRLEEYLAAAYNGGTTRISTSLRTSISEGLADWIGRLRQETQGYMVKLRKIRQLGIMNNNGLTMVR